MSVAGHIVASSSLKESGPRRSSAQVYGLSNADSCCAILTKWFGLSLNAFVNFVKVLFLKRLFLLFIRDVKWRHIRLHWNQLGSKTEVPE